MKLYIDDILAVLPFIVAVCGGLAVIVLDMFSAPDSKRSFLGGFSLLALVGIGISAGVTMGTPSETAFFGTVVADDFSRLLGVLFAAAAALAVLTAMGRLPEKECMRGEFYALLLFATGGATLMSQAADLAVLFIALETLSIPAYILAAAHRGSGRSTEAGFKYFILGAFSSGFLVYGIALVFGATGGTGYEAIRELTASGWMEQPMLAIGILMVLVSVLFKIGAAPFHMWAPDVYQGAPTPTTSFFATGIKAAAFAALIRFLFSAVPDMAEGSPESYALGWYPLLQGVAILTMTAANITALVQTDAKRILAYSSVAHAGYLFLGFLSDAAGVSAVLFYLFAYTFMTAGAFALIAFFERPDGGTSLHDLRGLGRRSPAAAAMLSVFLFSLAGIPPTAGFFGKFYLFKTAVDAGLTTLVIVAVLNSAVSAYYYLRIIVAMYMEPGDEKNTALPSPSIAITVSVIFSLFFVLAAGLYPSPLLEQAIAAAAALF